MNRKRTAVEPDLSLLDHPELLGASKDEEKRVLPVLRGLLANQKSKVAELLFGRPSELWTREENRELACLRAMFNHVIKAGVLVTNPVSITGAKALPENNEKNRVLTYEEQEKYLAHASPVLWDVASIILETGMRPEEVCRIRPENVHLDRDYLFNPYGKTKAAKRRIKLTSTVKSILTARMVACKGAYLFPHKDDPNRSVPKVNNAHDSALRTSGLEHFVIYDCRHTWATRAVEAGIDLVTLAAMMGHTRIQMVLRYAHPSQDHQSKAMDIIESHVAAERIALAEKNQSISAYTIQ